MPNLTAYIVLFLWPLVGVVLFRTQPPERALIWTILGGYLFLPVRPVIDFPMIPSIDKAVIASVVALIAVLVLRKGWAGSEPVAAVPLASGRGAVLHSRFGGPQRVERLPEAVPPEVAPQRQVRARQVPELRLMSKGWVAALCVMAALGVMATTLSNPEPVAAGPYLLPGMRAYDMISVLMGLGIMLIPFFLGWRFLGTPTGQRALLMGFALGGLLYAPLMLIEVRLSPQLNTWIYGFFPHSFAQHMRGDGFRPIVFLSHGLWVGIFMTMAILSSLALWRLTPTGVRPSDRLRWLVLAGGLMVVLVLAKSLGALIIALVLGVVVLLGGRRLVMLVAAGVAALVLFYPMARGVGLVPVEAVLSLAESVDADRAASFRFRLVNEDMLLAKANEKALFGWGGWGRGFIYNDWGNRISVTDGSWIILMNGFGWMGYLAQFGLLCLPVMRLAFRREIGPEGAFLAAVLAANLLDLIPNATLESITWLMAGAVAGTILPKGVRGGQGAGRRELTGTARRPVEGVAARRVSRT
ncbi:MAG: hypothetical protein H9533_05080 [Rhodobacteraceae bacterium]|nr:hypothetical protein [Paracoccaceae bacterium]